MKSRQINNRKNSATTRLMASASRVTANAASATFLLALLLLPASATLAAPAPAIIPVPAKMQVLDGSFRLGPDTRIYTDPASRGTGQYLAGKLRPSTGYPVEVSWRRSIGATIPAAIVLTTNSAQAGLGPEGYELTIETNTVVIRAPAQAGLFYGAQTLLQLLPPQIFSSKPVTGVDWRMPCVRIEDRPRFKWRGLMLDVSRHFYNKQQVERLLDLMALYKLNHFHWHLVDDQGWRIEIKKYPRLTQVGAWRDSIGFGLNPKDSSAYGPDGRYGGYYTQDEIREVVAYAAARHITVVPEIEMPGHSTAALTAYPQFRSIAGPSGVPTNGGVLTGIYSPANEQTFQFLEDILGEVFQLFPSQYIHIGGDEVQKDAWKNNLACQALMKREGLKNEEELQSWFVRRIEKFVHAHGHTLIGWSEILEGGLAQNAVVMDWIGGGKEAASQGHDVIMTPTGFCYFDYYQSLDHSLEPRAIGGYLPLRKVYSFEPVPAGLPRQDRPHVLGGQANVWTEYIASTNHLDYMVFPRLCALAEVVWSPRNERNWDDFQRRLAVDEKRLDQLGVKYRQHRSVELGNWSPSSLAVTNAPLSWDVSAHVTGPGQYHVILDYTHGQKGLTISRVALLEDGHEIAQDVHAGFAGLAPKDPVYLLNLPAIKAGAKYRLQVTAGGEGGTDSYGMISWVVVPTNGTR